jgi:periplasmic divalent cation tolerance protein
MDPPRLVEESELLVVLTTEATLELAETLATTLLDRGLVACVSLLPIVSHYRWDGRLTRSEEVQLLLKTHRPCLEALHAVVLALHSYDTPEWITLTAHTRGGYGQWCAAQWAGPTVRAGAAPPAPPGSPGAEDPTG